MKTLNRRQLLLGATAAVVAPALSIPKPGIYWVNSVEPCNSYVIVSNPVWTERILYGDSAIPPGGGGLL